MNRVFQGVLRAFLGILGVFLGILGGFQGMLGVFQGIRGVFQGVLGGFPGIFPRDHGGRAIRHPAIAVFPGPTRARGAAGGFMGATGFGYADVE